MSTRIDFPIQVSGKPGHCPRFPDTDCRHLDPQVPRIFEVNRTRNAVESDLLLNQKGI